MVALTGCTADWTPEEGGLFAPLDEPGSNREWLPFLMSDDTGPDEADAGDYLCDSFVFAGRQWRVPTDDEVASAIDAGTLPDGEYITVDSRERLPEGRHLLGCTREAGR